MSNKPKSFITVQESIGGWMAVMFWWNDEEPDIPDGFWEPWDTGFGRYATKDEAEVEAKSWAENEELEYVAPKSDSLSLNAVKH